MEHQARRICGHEDGAEWTDDEHGFSVVECDATVKQGFATAVLRHTYEYVHGWA